MEAVGTWQEPGKSAVADAELVSPFVPSPLPIVQRMLELARVGPGDKLFDLGSGDGRTVIMAAEKFGAEATGMELDDRLHRESSGRVARLGLHGRARILHGSMFQTDLRGATVVTLYQLTNVNQRLRPILERQLRPGTRVVSHDFPIPGWKHSKLVTGVLEDGSPHAIYLYLMERSKEETMPITADQRGYTAGKYGIELDGVMSGFLDEVDGGYAASDVVVEKIGADHIVHKHIAGVKYEDIVLSCGTGMSKGVFEAVKATLNGQFTRHNGAIVEYDFNYKEVSRLNFSNALVTEIGFPALDAASKDAARMTIKFSPEYTHRQTGGASSPAGPSTIDAKVQKKWLPSNFRLTIAGLDCTRVNKIEAITVKQKVVENPIGESRAYRVEPAYLEIPNLVITLAETHSQAFYDWHEDFVIKGNNGQDKEKSGALEYLAPDLKEVLLALNFTNLGIFRLTREKVEAGSENIRRVKAEMYCEGITFSYGTGIAASAGVKPAAARASEPVQAFQTTAIAPAQPAPRALPALRFRS